MVNTLLILIGKLINLISKTFNLGAGSTWPGHIALSVNPYFIQNILSKNPHLKVVLIAGTNGKTTTSKMIAAILEAKCKTFFQNTAGANLLNGVASSIIQNMDISGNIKKDFAIFEIDENTLPIILKQMKPYAIIMLNLFRDQLDRYGELDSIAKKWKEALSSLPAGFLILNADDPLIAYIGKNLTDIDVIYFGLPESKMNKKQPSHGADSLYCPKCGNKLVYSKIAYSHLGDWKCEHCTLQRPKTITKNEIHSPLPGLYNEYNTQAAAIFGESLGLSNKEIASALKNIIPAFGRQEIVEVDEKKIQIFLSKNPTSFNQSLETIISLASQDEKITIMFVLNDRIPDGRDVSWIWDTAIENHIDKIKNIIVSGDRVYDMALRVEYAQTQKYNEQLKIFENLKNAIEEGLKLINKDETLYILPTYTAMLEVRKILTGRKIL